MRIIAGSAKGRSLLGPQGSSKIRPTADRVREAIFNILGQWMEGFEVLDLYAGTGAMALEALSRGAALAVLVDSDPEARELCQKNAARLGFSAKVEIVASPAARAIADLSKKARKFQLIFADPPYGGEAFDVVQKVAGAQLLAWGGKLCIEHGKRETLPDSAEGVRRLDSRRFGDTAVSFFVLA